MELYQYLSDFQNPVNSCHAKDSNWKKVLTGSFCRLVCANEFLADSGGVGRGDDTMHIGDMLLKAGIVKAEQIESALKYQKSIGGHLGHILVKLGFVKEEQILEVLSDQMQIPTFDLDGFEPDPTLMDKLPQEVLLRLNVIPIRKEMGALVLGVSDPTDFAGLDELRLHAGGNIETVLITSSLARDILTNYFNECETVPPADGEDPKKVRSRRHGRNRLSNLISELEQENKVKESGLSVDEIDRFDISSVPTRQLVRGLVELLKAKGLIYQKEFAAIIAALPDEPGEE